MELYFLRHGDAEDAGPGHTDHERRLTDRGREETRRVAEAFRRAGVTPDRIVSTPLVRAQQTAEILREVLGTASAVESDLPAETQLGDVQRALETGGAPTMFVGHAPYLGQVAGLLIGGPALHLAKSACARVDTVLIEPGQGRLVWLVTPEVA